MILCNQHVRSVDEAVGFGNGIRDAQRARFVDAVWMAHQLKFEDQCLRKNRERIYR